MTDTPRFRKQKNGAKAPRSPRQVKEKAVPRRRRGLGLKRLRTIGRIRF